MKHLLRHPTESQLRNLYLHNAGPLQEDLSREVLHDDVAQELTCGSHQVGAAAP